MDLPLYLADHGALQALPFFVPAVVIGAFLVGARLRDRHRRAGGS